VVAAVRAWGGDLDRVAVWVRDADAVRWVGAELPQVARALLRDTSSDESTHRYLGDAAAAGATEVSLHERAIAPWVVAEAHRLGLRAYCWIIHLDRQPAAIEAGVDGLVTDWPERVPK
jgi:glycerophosphoryl diester phosphodiesterase